MSALTEIFNPYCSLQQIIALIEDAGFEPVERDTVYNRFMPVTTVG
jgi:2-iminoacetate synthase ThiH